MRPIRTLPFALIAFAVAACSSDLPTDASLQTTAQGEITAQSEHLLGVELCKSWLGDGPAPEVKWHFSVTATSGPTDFQIEIDPYDGAFDPTTDAWCKGAGSWPADAIVTFTEIVPDGYVLKEIHARNRTTNVRTVNPEGSDLEGASFTFSPETYFMVWFKNDEGEPALEVEKTAETYFTQTYKWAIDKSADLSELAFAEGESGSVEYTVVVGATPVDSGWGVKGTITITNPAAVPANVTGVSDEMTGGITASVVCDEDLPYLLPAGQTLECTYEADLPDAGDRTNTVTVTTLGDVLGNTADADVDFSEAEVTHVDTKVDVDDSLAGFLGTVSWNDDLEDRTFTYTLTFGSGDEFDIQVACGESNHPNVASFETNDTETTGSDNWNVKVTVECTPVGCALSPGYWMTHSEYGPAPYDETWAELPDGADTPFFLSGSTHLGVMQTPPRGNAYYNLAFQYVATLLNGLAGADLSEVQDAFDRATEIFETYTPAQIGALRGNDALRQEIIGIAGLLDQYNNGVIGPGKCDS